MGYKSAPARTATTQPTARSHGFRCITEPVLDGRRWLVTAVVLLWKADDRRPVAALTLECAALTASGLAVASGIACWSDTREAGLAAGPAVGRAAALAILLPRWTMYATPDADWTQAHLRRAVLGAATAVLVQTLRDPAGRIRTSPSTRPPPEPPEPAGLPCP